MMRRRQATAILAALPLLGGCGRSSSQRRSEDETIVFKHQPLWGDTAPFEKLLDDFRARTGWKVVTEALPSSSDAAHQFFLTALEGGDESFDLLVADVVWVPEFAKAGWVADLSPTFPTEAIRRDFIQGAADAVIVDGKTYAVPWYADVGLLYRRTDLAPNPVRTYDALVSSAMEAKASGACEYGYVWQGRQYEGLVCNAFEAIWGHGGKTLDGERIRLDTPEARDALSYMRSLLVRKVSPPAVTSMAEEESRRPFQSGRAAFMRNWPYALVEAEREGSAIRGRVAVDTLPTLDGSPGFGTLGGYQLAMNARTPALRAERTAALIEHLTSPEANVAMAVAYGRNPPRRSVYSDDRLRRGAPHVAALVDVIAQARPRPVTPYYALLADTLQSELSAAVSGIRDVSDALGRAQAACDRIMGTRAP